MECPGNVGFWRKWVQDFLIGKIEADLYANDNCIT
jgi:hypothetical protein